jgi:hypothetical protein
MRSSQFWIALGSVALAACSSPNPYAGPQKQLAQDAKRIAAGEYQAASRDLERMIAQSDRDDAGARLQALYAAHLLTQTHALASLGSPFLREPSIETGLGGGAPRHSGVGHVVAASMYAALGRELSANVESAPREHKGVKLLPAEFDGFEPKDVRANLALFQMVALARLGFDERVRDFVAGSAEMHNFEACTKLLDRLRVAPGLRPWIHAAAFDYLRRSESTEPESYKFAVQALVAAADSGGAFDARRREELATWIRSGSNYEYRCPEHRILVQPELGRCQEIGCQRALFEFTPQRKSN